MLLRSIMKYSKDGSTLPVVLVKNMLLYTHTCPVTEFAVASHLKYGKFLLPPRFLTALSVPKVPTRV